jgi:predicted DNA binding CopG/RHH family protein
MTAHVNFRLPCDEIVALKRLAHSRGTNFSQEIRRAIRMLLASGA